MPNDPELTAQAVRALNEGRKVERRDSQAHPWERCGTDHLSYLLLHRQLDSNRLRIAPEPTFVPWTLETCPIGAVVKSKNPELPGRFMIVCAFPEGAAMGIPSDDRSIHSYEDLLMDFVQLDGTCCGKAAQS